MARGAGRGTANIKEVVGDVDHRFVGLHVKCMPSGESFTVSRNWLANGKGHPKFQVLEHQDTVNIRCG